MRLRALADAGALDDPPPVAELIELIAEEKERLDRFLSRKLPEFSRSRLAEWIAAGKVKVDGRLAKPSFALAAGMNVSVEPLEDKPVHDLAPASIPLDVVFEDDYLLAVNKPRGLATHPAPSLKEPSLVNALLARSHELSQAGGAFRPGIVHRLDKDTTGLLLVAKTDAVHVRLAKQIEEKSAVRRYLAVAAGWIEHERFDVAVPLARSKKNRILMAIDPKGKPATTHFKKLASLAEGSFLAASLETGRTHQIRVHLQSVGHPVLGDRLYAPKEFRNHPLQLHAAYLAFTHPVTGARLELLANPPSDFLAQDLDWADSLQSW